MSHLVFPEKLMHFFNSTISKLWFRNEKQTCFGSLCLVHPYWTHNRITGSKVRPSPFPEVPTKRQMLLLLFTPSWARY